LEIKDKLDCANDWSFNFDDDHLQLADSCPAAVKLLEAVGEDFEGGRVYRHTPDPDYTADQCGAVYVVYNDGEWVTFPDNWDTSQPSNDPKLVPLYSAEPGLPGGDIISLLWTMASRISYCC
jgi:hypothetical protein